MNVAAHSRIPGLPPPPSSPRPGPVSAPRPTSSFSWTDGALVLGCAGFLSVGVRSMGLWPAVELGLAERAGGYGIAVGRAASIVATLWCGLVLHQLFARIASMKAARLALVMVVCLPILAARARLLGDGALGMAATTTTFVGFTLALRESESARPWTSWLWLALGAASAVAATKLVGPALGLFAPAAGAALDWRSNRQPRLLREPDQRESEEERAQGRVSRRVSIAVVSTSAAVGIALFARMPAGTLPPAPFDRPLSLLAHETFPLSALLPILLAAVVGERTSRCPDGRRATATNAGVGAAGHGAALRTSLLFMGMLFIAEAASQARGFASAHVMPIGVAALFAAAFGEREHEPSPTALFGALVLVVLLALDFTRLPEKLVLGFGPAATLPAAARSIAIKGHVAAALLCGAGTTGALAMVLFAKTRARGLARWVVLGGALLGAVVIRFFALEPIVRAASPKGAIEAYTRIAKDHEPIGVLGIDVQVARLTGAPDAQVLATPEVAASWLSGVDGPTPNSGRRFVATAREQLAPLNARYRAVLGRNAPVLDARGSDAVLVASGLLAGEKSESPLDALVLDAVPPGLVMRSARFGDALEVVGWSIVDARGAPSALSSSVTGGTRKLRVVLRVLRGFKAGGHCTFVHAERTPTRFSDEHREWTDYPMASWAPGDLIVDTFEIRLPAAFRGGTELAVPLYYGVGVLPCADNRRMPLTRGEGNDNRALLGHVEVR